MPHDLFHFVAESTLGMRAGLYGHVAWGCELGFGDERNPSRVVIEHGKVELAQSESLVECLQAEVWGGTVPFEQWMDILAVTCRTRNVEPPVLTEGEVDRLRKAVGQMCQRWDALPVGGFVDLVFEA
jgi:hypothetical protein